MSSYAFFKGLLLLSLPFDEEKKITFCTKTTLRALAFNWGCFPLEKELYHSYSDCLKYKFSIRSLLKVSKRRSPHHLYSALPLVIIVLRRST